VIATALSLSINTNDVLRAADAHPLSNGTFFNIFAGWNLFLLSEPSLLPVPLMADPN
jgi:hypothetical protein